MNNGKYSPEIVEEICKYVTEGNSHKDAAGLAGISESQFYEWQDKASRQYHPEFTESLKKAEQACKARNIAHIQRAATKSWQAAAWWMERKYNNEFALKQVNELQGKDGKELPGFAFIIGNGYDPLSRSTKIDAPSEGSVVSDPPAVQSVDMASKGQEDNNSNLSDGGAGTA